MAEADLHNLLDQLIVVLGFCELSTTAAVIHTQQKNVSTTTTTTTQTRWATHVGS